MLLAEPPRALMPVVRRDRDNIGDCKGAVVVVPYDLEAEAFDALGPQVRAVLNDSPIKILAYPIFQECKAAGLDPLDPKLDAMAAANIRAGACGVVLRDRSPEDARLGMRPLRARFKAKRRG